MSDTPKAGLLPLYLALYDQALPDMRQVLEPFLDSVAAGLADAGVEVLRAPCVLRRWDEDVRLWHACRNRL